MFELTAEDWKLLRDNSIYQTVSNLAFSAITLASLNAYINAVSDLNGPVPFALLKYLYNVREIVSKTKPTGVIVNTAFAVSTPIGVADRWNEGVIITQATSTLEIGGVAIPTGAKVIPVKFFGVINVLSGVAASNYVGIDLPE